MTFSKEAAIDFDEYQTARVEMTLFGEAAFWGEAEAVHYLVQELQQTSGFRWVTDSANESTDLVLQVNLLLRSEVTTDEDGNEDTQFDGDANFTAVDRSGDRIDGGSVSDSSLTARETMEDTLDEVAHHYLAPFRL